jgi:hypothetical protein
MAIESLPVLNSNVDALIPLDESIYKDEIKLSNQHNQSYYQ